MKAAIRIMRNKNRQIEKRKWSHLRLPGRIQLLV